MGNMKTVLAAVTLAAASLILGSLALAGEESGKDLLSEDKAIQMALDAYPGVVVKAYKETRRGGEVWDVEIKNKDGRMGKFYYDVKTHELVKSGFEYD
jgi:uncharacterized membrane protein YkoI